MDKQITLLHDYKNIFYCPHKHSNTPTDMAKLGDCFAALGYQMHAKRFCDIDFRRDDYRNKLVLYQSSQDPELHYKSYIEDVVLGLQLQGAKIIPDFHLFRAHHNKVFMEIVRDLTPVDQVRTLVSKCYGTYEDFAADINKITFPAVIKAAAGDSGKQVALVQNAKEARRVVKKLSFSLTWEDVRKNLYKRIFTRGWRLDSWHRKKFIVQEFLPGLDHDWKTIVFGNKYFVSVRPTREDDFRASGSPGARTYPTELPAGLLDFLETVFTSFTAPYASIDVLWDGKQFYLGEIQFLRFGTGALIRNPHHWRRDADRQWSRVEGTCEWERELAECVVNYAENTLDSEDGSPAHLGLR
jgi:glutathione synthase/RimK-type ligase-like ATP-grasp enzyme